MKPTFKLGSALLFALVMLLFVGCKKEPYPTLIPKDASSVTSIRLNKLIKNYGEADLKQLTKTDTLPSLVQQLIAKPTESGIDFDAPLYIFTLGTGANTQTYATIALTDAKKFRNFIEQQSDYAQQPTITEEAGLTFYQFDLYSIAANTKVALLGNLDNRGFLLRLFDQKETDCILTLESFKNIDSNKNAAISTFIPAQTKLTQMLAWQGIKNIPIPSYNEPVELVQHITFDAGKVRFNWQLFPVGDKAKTELSHTEKIFTKKNSRFLKQIPAEYVTVLSFGTNGKELMKLLAASNLMGKESKLIGQEGMNALASINGTITMAMAPESSHSKLPRLVAFVECDATKIYDTLHKNFGFLAREIGQSTLNVAGTLFIAKQEGYLAISTVRELTQTKEISPSINENNQASALKSGSLIGAYIKDIEYLIPQPKTKKRKAQTVQPQPTPQTPIEYIEFEMNSAAEMQATLFLKEKKKNALDPIVRYLLPQYK